MMRCGWTSNISWPLTLLLDSPRHRPIPDCLGFIAPAYQLITTGFLPLSVWLVSIFLGKTTLLHLPAQTGLPCLLVQPILCSSPLESILAKPPHLPIQPGPPHLHVLVGLLLVDCPGLAHEHVPACLFALTLLIAPILPSVKAHLITTP